MYRPSLNVRLGAERRAEHRRAKQGCFVRTVQGCTVCERRGWRPPSSLSSGFIFIIYLSLSLRYTDKPTPIPIFTFLMITDLQKKVDIFYIVVYALLV